jgi:hypothetical protein
VARVEADEAPDRRAVEQHAIATVEHPASVELGEAEEADAVDAVPGGEAAAIGGDDLVHLPAAHAAGGVLDQAHVARGVAVKEQLHEARRGGELDGPLAHRPAGAPCAAA